jgi:streptomycin 6-kinase
VAPESGTDTGRLEARMAEKAEIMGEAVGKDCAETVVVAAGLSAAWLKPAFLVE